MELNDLSEQYPNESAKEIALRQSTQCAGCGKAKDIGLVVCWSCWKGWNGKPSFQDFHGSINEWLDYIK